MSQLKYGASKRKHERENKDKEDSIEMKTSDYTAIIQGILLLTT